MSYLNVDCLMIKEVMIYRLNISKETFCECKRDILPLSIFYFCLGWRCHVSCWEKHSVYLQWRILSCWRPCCQMWRKFTVACWENALSEWVALIIVYNLRWKNSVERNKSGYITAYHMPMSWSPFPERLIWSCPNFRNILKNSSAFSSC